MKLKPFGACIRIEIERKIKKHTVFNSVCKIKIDKSDRSSAGLNEPTDNYLSFVFCWKINSKIFVIFGRNWISLTDYRLRKYRVLRIVGGKNKKKHFGNGENIIKCKCLGDSLESRRERAPPETEPKNHRTIEQQSFHGILSKGM